MVCRPDLWHLSILTAVPVSHFRERVVKKGNPNLKVTTKIHIGRPAEKIVETCIDDGFDLIVIGGEGLGGIKERILGSVSDKVAHTAPCPVTIIK